MLLLNINETGFEIMNTVINNIRINNNKMTIYK